MRGNKSHFKVFLTLTLALLLIFLTVYFASQSTDGITSRNWDFKDNSPLRNNKHSNHDQLKSETYTLAPPVTEPAWLDTEFREEHYTTVNYSAPVADFTANATSGAAPLTVHFIDQSTGNVTGWFWDFGDGGASTEQNPVYPFNDPGTYSVSLIVTGLVGSDTETKTRYISVNQPRKLYCAPGVVRLGSWYLDMNGNGELDDCETDACLGQFGLPADLPVAGDWNGDGFDQIGVFRGGFWILDMNDNGRWDGCETDACLGQFGLPADLPVTGDWNGDGFDQIGVFRGGFWYLDMNDNGRWDGCETDACLGQFGLPADLPVSGDWNGDGLDQIGVFRDGHWYLDMSGNGEWNGCKTDACLYQFDLLTDLPVAGDWNGDGFDQIGVLRDGYWYLDMNGNDVWEGCETDACNGRFGLPADKAVCGRW